MECACVYVREREREREIVETQGVETKNAQANVLTKEKGSTTYKVGGGCFI